jgi:cytochrome c5
MTMRPTRSLALLIFATTTAFSQTPQSATQTTQKPPAATHTAQHVDEGQRIFEENCSRCHTAPNGFSPHIAGTVLRHMRVRASLSEHDEKELLRFFNP